ncbi:MAG: TlpA family protein disulfide reductase, partial [Solirubrobacteraceae bacterium]
TTVALVFVGLLTIVVVCTGFSLWHRNRLLTERGRASRVPVALEVGQAVPEVDLETEDGSNLTATELVDVDDDRRAIFVFTTAGCAPCIELLPELVRWREVLQARLDIRVLAGGDEQENRRLAAQHGIPLLLDRDGAAVRAFGVEGTPSAVEVDALGRVASPTALGAAAIEGLIRAALEHPARVPGLEVR